ncbi:hypothetical protein BD770DRAFT_389343 [Pilaira anomala]|nr:hypothetical protein BD770DRAFT_389343 [Pilaira anomala]
MHITNRLIWCVLILFIKSIKSIEYKDFGLPNNGNPCLVSVNQTVHIINSNEQSLSIKFNRPWNKTAPDIIKRPSMNLSTAAGSCCLTQSGKVILFPFQQSQHLQDLKLQLILSLPEALSYPTLLLLL